MKRSMDKAALDIAMKSLAIRLAENQSAPVEIVVCGGSALILTGMIRRTTQDVDVVALIRSGHLASPAPLPDELVRAAAEVAEDLALERNWLNNGPSRGEGGLFQMGLPDGFAERLTPVIYGDRLKVHFTSISSCTHRPTGAVITSRISVLWPRPPMNWKPQRGDARCVRRLPESPQATTEGTGV